MDIKLTEILADVFGKHTAEINKELTKADVDSWDSLKQMDLVLSLEREYNLTLELMDIVNMTSVGKIIEVLISKGVDLDNQ